MLSGMRRDFETPLVVVALGPSKRTLSPRNRLLETRKPLAQGRSGARS
jgi:hypothetical protein